MSDSLLKIRVEALRQEIRRITRITLRGNFVLESDRTFWEKRLEKLNGELAALEATV